MAQKRYQLGEFDVTDSVFATSDHCFAIYNISPIVPGHSLIIPTEKVSSLLNLKPDRMQEFFQFGTRVTKFLVEVFSGTGFDWTIQDGRDAGQSIPHLHLHVMPRIKDDFPNPGDWYQALENSQVTNIDDTDRVRLSPGEVERIAGRLRSQWDRLAK